MDKSDDENFFSRGRRNYMKMWKIDLENLNTECKVHGRCFLIRGMRTWSLANQIPSGPFFLLPPFVKKNVYTYDWQWVTPFNSIRLGVPNALDLRPLTHQLFIRQLFDGKIKKLLVRLFTIVWIVHVMRNAIVLYYGNDWVVLVRRLRNNSNMHNLKSTVDLYIFWLTITGIKMRRGRFGAVENCWIFIINISLSKENDKFW